MFIFSLFAFHFSLIKMEEQIKALESQLIAEKTKNAALETALETVASEKEALESQLSELATTKAGSSVSSKREELYPADWSEKTFKLGKDSYGFLVPQFGYKGETVTYAEILADTTLQKELVEDKNGCILKIQN